MDRQPAGRLLADTLGLTTLARFFTGRLSRENEQTHLVSLPVAAIARGTVDVTLNVGIICSPGY